MEIILFSYPFYTNILHSIKKRKHSFHLQLDFVAHMNRSNTQHFIWIRIEVFRTSFGFKYLFFPRRFRKTFFLSSLLHLERDFDVWMGSRWANIQASHWMITPRRRFNFLPRWKAEAAHCWVVGTLITRKRVQFAIHGIFRYNEDANNSKFAFITLLISFL